MFVSKTVSPFSDGEEGLSAIRCDVDSCGSKTPWSEFGGFTIRMALLLFVIDPMTTDFLFCGCAMAVMPNRSPAKIRMSVFIQVYGTSSMVKYWSKISSR